jgi:hypothetical protein
VSTDPDGHAEVQVGSTTLRLGSARRSESSCCVYDDEQVSLQLHHGALAATPAQRRRGARVRPAHRGGPLRDAACRPLPLRSRPTTRARLHGVVGRGPSYEGPGSALTVQARPAGEFWMKAARRNPELHRAECSDCFAAWNAQRDQAEARSASSQYVSPEMTGAGDLDRYGPLGAGAEIRCASGCRPRCRSAG